MEADFPRRGYQGIRPWAGLERLSKAKWWERTPRAGARGALRNSASGSLETVSQCLGSGGQ